MTGTSGARTGAGNVDTTQDSKGIDGLDVPDL
jgi:hypothetical protein